jgi:hypothetical protein
MIASEFIGRFARHPSGDHRVLEHFDLFRSIARASLHPAFQGAVFRWRDRQRKNGREADYGQVGKNDRRGDRESRLKCYEEKRNNRARARALIEPLITQKLYVSRNSTFIRF